MFLSGALCFVALVLLVVGFVGSGLGLFYASILVSVFALVSLGLGVRQLRGERAPAPAVGSGGAHPGDRGLPDDAQGGPVAAASPVPAQPADDATAAQELPPLEHDEDALDGEDVAGVVLVVAGRPRYHVGGCRYLQGEEVEAVDVVDAREEGFTPCGVCTPDALLAALVEQAEPEDDRGLDGLPGAALAGSPTASAPLVPAVAVAAPVSGGRTVVVVPDTGTFHRPDCRYVRAAPDTEQRTRGDAVEQGYDACGSCKP